MASSIGSESISTTTNQQLASSAAVGKEKVFVVLSGNIQAGAAPSDVDLYVNPAGRTLWVTDIMVAGDNNNNLRLFDKVGTIDAANDRSVVMIYTNNDGGNYQNNIHFSVPIFFQHGIGIDVLDMTANKNYRYIIQGYLI